jgi:hypothetical protein
MNALRHAPAAPSRVAPASVRVRNASSGTIPPWSRAELDRARHPGVERVVADSKPTPDRLALVARRSVPASPGSSRRQYAGSEAGLAQARTASTAAAKSAGCSRSRAWVDPAAASTPR